MSSPKFVELVVSGLADIVNNALAAHLAEKLEIKESKIKKALQSYDWPNASVDWSNVKDKTSKAPEKKATSTSKKPQISLKNKVANAKDKGQWYCVDCAQGRTIARGTSTKKTYVFYECGLAGIRDSEKLQEAMKELGIEDEEPIKSDDESSGKEKKDKKKKKDSKEKEPKASKGKKKVESSKGKKKGGFKPKANDFDNLWDAKSKIVFEDRKGEYIAVSNQEEDGNVGALTEEQIEICKEKGWKYEVLDAEKMVESVVKSTKKVRKQKELKKQQKKQQKQAKDDDDETEDEQPKEDEEATQDETPEGDDEDVKNVEKSLLAMDEEDE